MVTKETEQKIREQLTLMGYADLAINKRVINAIHDILNYGDPAVKGSGI